MALPYLTKNDTVATISIDGVAPTLENTYSGKYNVWGYEHIYTSKNPKAAVKAFLDTSCPPNTANGSKNWVMV